MVKVGAAKDASWDTVFRSITSQAKRARVVVSEELTAGGKAGGAGIKKGLSAADKAFANLEREISGKGRDLLTPATRSTIQFGQEASRRFSAVASDFKAMQREIDSILRKSQRDQAQRSLGVGKYSTGSTFGRLGGHASAIAGGIGSSMSFGGRVLGDIMHGAGINTDLGSYIGTNMGIESKAVQLSNSAYIPSEHGAAGQRVDPKQLEKEARQVANETAQSATDALDGLIAFTEKTGDLDTGRKILKDMAVLSKATGSNMSDTVLAAAAISNQLGDIPNKGEAATEVMRVFAGQGQVGAIEIRNMATQMTKLAAQARNFKVNEETAALLGKLGVGTDIGQSIAVLGALSQASMQTGGRGTATTATNSAQAFVRDLMGQTAQKRFKAAGIDIYSDNGHTKERDPIDIIRDVLTKTHGKGDEIAHLLSNVNSRAPVMAFAAHYNAAVDQSRAVHREKHKKYGSAKEEAEADNAAGLAAVTEKYNEFLSVTMVAGEIQEKYALAMQTGESQVTVFNNKMAETTATMMDEMRPALIAMLPAMVSLTGVMTDGAKRLMHMFGFDEAAADRASADTRGKAQDATAGLNRTYNATKTTDANGFEHHTISEEQVEMAKRAQALQQALVDKQQAEVTKTRGSLGSAGFDLGLPGLRNVGGGGDGMSSNAEQQEAFKNKQQDLERNKAKLEELTNTLRALDGREMLAQLTIIAKNTAAAKTAPTAGGTPESLPP